MDTSLNDLPLRDIHLPASALWWPPAPGWWLAMVGFLALILVARALFKNRTKPNLKREATLALNEIEQSFSENQDTRSCVEELSKFFRRVVISRDSSSNAAITGDAWLRILDEGLQGPEFSEGEGRLLLSAPYLPDVSQKDALKLLNICKRWVEGL